jgi:hypothetical protein
MELALPFLVREAVDFEATLLVRTGDDPYLSVEAPLLIRAGKILPLEVIMPFRADKAVGFEAPLPFYVREILAFAEPLSVRAGKRVRLIQPLLWRADNPLVVEFERPLLIRAAKALAITAPLLIRTHKIMPIGASLLVRADKPITMEATLSVRASAEVTFEAPLTIRAAKVVYLKNGILIRATSTALDIALWLPGTARIVLNPYVRYGDLNEEADTAASADWAAGDYYSYDMGDDEEIIEITGEFPAATIAEIVALARAVKGKRTPFWFANQTESRLVRLWNAEELEYAQTSYSLTKITIRLRVEL